MPGLRWADRVLLCSTAGLLSGAIDRGDSVLDLGCGTLSCLATIPHRYSLGVELFLPYLEEARRRRTHSEYLEADVTRLNFPPRSFDVVLACWLLEHLEKAEGQALLSRMEQWARKRVLITVPNGEQDEPEQDSNPHQRQRSAWSAGELCRAGYQVYGLEAALSRRTWPWFIRLPLRFLTARLYLRRPESAASLFAVKTLP